MKNGFIRCAAVSPNLRVADCEFNTKQIIEKMRECEKSGASLVCFPELSVTGATCGDLFMQKALIDAAEQGVAAIVKASKKLDIVAVVGVPVLVRGALYSCAAVICDGELLGLVPKAYFSSNTEKRFFSDGSFAVSECSYAGRCVPFGASIVFENKNDSSLVLGVELGADLCAPVPPSTSHALAGATVICNLSANAETVGAEEFRKRLVADQSSRLICGYVLASAGSGESTTDAVFAGHNLIAECGNILAEAKPFSNDSAITEIDLDKIAAERAKSPLFETSCEDYCIRFFELKRTEVELTREVDFLSFVPSCETDLSARCERILDIQAHGLAKRLLHVNAKSAVLGISGGLDSTLALLVCVRAFKLLKRDLKDIVAITMPCFGTTKRTRTNAQLLCEAVGVTFKEICIADTVTSHFKDIGQDADNFDVTFENSQARVRTLVLMDYANKTGGFVVGTGNLSELALGWATYNGDHMSMYGVNAGLPKTLLRHIVRYVADDSQNQKLSGILYDILNTPISPELLPMDENGNIAQQTEKLVGPYELHDFFLYYAIRYGFSPNKIFTLAKKAFEGKYENQIILYWLKSFYRRFFAQQFKRSCLPDGPRVGSVSLSPRGAWNMPSDAINAVWQKELEDINL